MIEKAPLRFVPYLKSVIWGGDKICRLKGLDRIEGVIGESWEISALPEHETLVAEGKYKGMSIARLIDSFGEDFLGAKVIEKFGYRFPLLFKFLDAAENLSVQVHPDDRFAAEHHDCSGKTEMLYVIKAENGAKILSGFKKQISKEEYLRRVENNTFEEVLASHDCKPGDIFFIPSGRPHSIGAGCFLAEIQESSDLTYRIYDYGRSDSQGNTRELHTALAKDALNYETYDNYKIEAASDDADDCLIMDCELFKVRRVILRGSKELNFNKGSFTVIMCVERTVRINTEEGECGLKSGETILVPAVVSKIRAEGDARLLITQC